MNKRFHWLYCVVLLSSAAQAALFSDDEARRAIQRTDQNIQTLDSRLRQVEDAQHNQTDVLGQFEQLRLDVAQLRGQIEVLQNDLNQLKQSQHDFYTDLDRRIKSLENNNASGDSTPSTNNSGTSNAATMLHSSTNQQQIMNELIGRSKPANNEPAIASKVELTPTSPGMTSNSPEIQSIIQSWKASPSNEHRQYDQAMQRWKTNQYGEAAPLFFQFSKLYPKSVLAPMSLYYAGLSWRMIKNNPSAQHAFQNIIEYYPESPKMPNALFVLGQIAYEQGDNGSARRLWRDVADQYPKSDVAKKARLNLETYK